MNNKDITAQWARETSQEVLGNKVNEQVLKCLSAIKIAVEQNKLSTDVTLWAEPLTIKELQKRGFVVVNHEEHSQRDPSYVSINW